MSEDKNICLYGSENKYDKSAAEVFKKASGWVDNDKSEVTDSSNDGNKKTLKNLLQN